MIHDLIFGYEASQNYYQIQNNCKLENYFYWNVGFHFQNFLLYKGLNYKGVYELIKLRLSSHNLEIEVGRYGKSYIPRKIRLCKLCHLNEIEDVEHYIFI